MRTTDDILADLHKRADGGEDVRQLVIAHETLARMRAERSEAIKADDKARTRDLDTHIRYWLTMVAEDVDDRVAEAPRKDSVQLVGEAGPETMLPPGSRVAK